MITPDNYLNIVGILINEVFGSVFLFILIGLCVITYICVINSFDTSSTININAVFILLTLGIYYNQLLLAIIILLIGLGVYLKYDKLFNR